VGFVAASLPFLPVIGRKLGSCAQWQAEQEQRQREQAQAQAAAIAANDDAQCRSYGAAPGLQSYIQCRTNLDNRRAQMRQMIAGQLIGHMLNQ
jgi:hypothetical protein